MVITESAASRMNPPRPRLEPKSLAVVFDEEFLSTSDERLVARHPAAIGRSKVSIGAGGVYGGAVGLDAPLHAHRFSLLTAYWRWCAAWRWKPARQQARVRRFGEARSPTRRLPGMIKSWLSLPLLVAAGCYSATVGPRLEYRELRLDEASVPMPFVIAVENTGDAPAVIEEISVTALHKTLVSRTSDADRAPAGLDLAVDVRDDHPTRIEPGQTGVACGFLRWEMPPDPPPMLAVAQCVFHVRYRTGEVLATEPVALVLQSRSGLFQTAPNAGDLRMTEMELGQEQAARVCNALKDFPGQKSPGLRALANQLRNTAADPLTEERAP